MKTNRTLLGFTLFIFLAQTLLQPALAAGPSENDRRQTAVPVIVPAMGTMFDTGVPVREQRLITDYIQSVADAIPHRQTLRQASEELVRTLEADSRWFSLAINDDTMADLLEGANSGRRYLLDKTAPAETRLHAQQEELETQVVEDLRTIAANGSVPDGFMERIRSLDYLYSLQDQLWEMKFTLLFKIIGLSRNVHTNYLAEHPAEFQPLLSPLAESLKKLDGIVRKAADASGSLDMIRERQERAQSRFSATAVADLAEDKNETQSLLTAVRQQSQLLKSKGTPGEKNHGLLLDAVAGVLEERLGDIDLGIIRNTTQAPPVSPFHVSPDLGALPETAPLAEDYRRIVHGFFDNTAKKLGHAQALKQHLDATRKTLQQEGVFFQSLVQESTRDIDSKENLISRSREIIDTFSLYIDGMIADLEPIIELAAPLNFSDPDTLITDPGSALRALDFNRRMDDYLTQAEDIDQNSFQMDLQLYGLIASQHGTGRLDRLKSYGLLEKTSLSKFEAIVSLQNDIAAINGIKASDRNHAEALKKLGQSLLSTSHAQLQKTITTATARLGGPFEKGVSPYRDFLQGTLEELSSRAANVEAMLSLASDTGGTDASLPDCLDCQPEIDIWGELANLGDAYTDAIQQIDDLPAIEACFSQDLIDNSSSTTQILTLFELSRLLGDTPSFQLNDDHIDAIFTAGSTFVTVKGIGNPLQLDLTGLSIVNDYLLYRPYIGGWLSKIKSGASRILSPIGTGLLDGANRVISTAKAAGGKISTAGSRALDFTTRNLKRGGRALGNFASGTADFVKNTARNAFNNAFMNDPDKPGGKRSVSGWKVAGYILGGIGCAAASAGTAGLAAPACIALALSAGIDVAKGSVDTAASKNYNWISKRNADRIKFGLDIAGIVGGGYLNFKDAGKAWKHMGKIGKALTLIGAKPGDLKGYSRLWKADWAKVANKLSMAGKLAGTASAFRNLYDWGTTGVKATAQVLKFGALVAEARWHGELTQKGLLEYGNWYGPGWWGGDRLKDKPGDRGPINSVDAIAMRHDFYYQIAEEQGRIFGKAEEYRIKAIADAWAVQASGKLDKDPTKWDLPELNDPAKASRYARRMNFGFGYTSPGYNVAETALDGYNWVTSPIEQWTMGSVPRLDEAQLQSMVDARVKDWYRKHPGALGAPPGLSGSSQQGTGLPGSTAPGSAGGQPGQRPGAASPGTSGGSSGTPPGSSAPGSTSPGSASPGSTGGPGGTSPGYGTPGTSSSPSGVLLPQGGSRSGGPPDSPGVSLLPGGGKKPDIPQSQGVPENTYKDIPNPYKDMVNPYKNMKNPYKGRKKPKPIGKSPFL